MRYTALQCDLICSCSSSCLRNVHKALLEQLMSIGMSCPMQETATKTAYLLSSHHPQITHCGRTS